MPSVGITGRRIAYLRSEQDMSQDTLVARLQCLGLDITRDVLANMECGRKKILADFLPYFQCALDVPIARFFAQDVQDLDAKLSARDAAGLLKTRSRNAKG